MGTRIALLLAIAWVMSLTEPLFSIFGELISGRGIILLAGGLFLLAKSPLEIHNALEGHEERAGSAHPVHAGYLAILVQIALIDIVFSLDSVITAVGMADHIEVMVLAIIIAVGVMMLSARSINEFVDSHPTIKMLALSFLVLIGVALMTEGLELHIPKGYIYVAMAFSVIVEILNMKIRARSRRPVTLHKSIPGDKEES